MIKCINILLLAVLIQSSAEEKFLLGGSVKSDLLFLNDLPTEFSRSSQRPLPDYSISRNIFDIWGQYRFSQNYTIKLGTLSSFREYFNGETPRNDYSLPSEILLNEAYIDIDNFIGENFKLRLGRQHLKYGRGRIIFEPNPLDAVRTSFFDAAKVSWTLNHNQIDFVGFKNNDYNSFVLNKEPRRLANDDVHGAIIYGRNKSLSFMPYEYYYVFTSENFDQRRETHTLGTRILPHFNENIFAEVELAGQAGKVGAQQQRGMLLFTSLAYKMNLDGYQPTFKAGSYFLSGDDPETSTNEAWNGALSGWAQFSNLMIISNIGGNQGFSRFNNLNRVFAELSFPIYEGELKFSYWKLKAEKANRVGLGRNRGDLFMVKLDYPLTEKLHLEIISEWLNIGNYYPDKMNDAHFLRFRLSYKF